MMRDHNSSCTVHVRVCSYVLVLVPSKVKVYPNFTLTLSESIKCVFSRTRARTLLRAASNFTTARQVRCGRVDAARAFII